MMTNLSVNLNKIALLRNSRGRDMPNVLDFAMKFCALGVQGLTIHPRPDERHIKMQDARDLSKFLRNKENVELNIEGYPSEAFLKLVEETQPDQCTLVPDAENQLTSDHGWDLSIHTPTLIPMLDRIQKMGVRTALFLDPDIKQVALAAKTGVDRIELYTALYAHSFETEQEVEVLSCYRDAAREAQSQGLGVNAGHDLDLKNLPLFLSIEGIQEVSIGHVLTIECIEQGLHAVTKLYLEICSDAG